MPAREVDGYADIVPVQGIATEWTAANDRKERAAGWLRAGFDNFIEAGAVLREAYARDDWKTLGYKDMTQYFAELGISRSIGYDLISLADLRDQFPDLYSKMLSAGKSKMRLLIPHTLEATPESMDAMLEDANALTWNDLRQRYGGDDHEREQANGYIQKNCPRCNRAIWLSREADLYAREP